MVKMEMEDIVPINIPKHSFKVHEVCRGEKFIVVFAISLLWHWCNQFCGGM
jgi:hypothetical protein